MRLQEPELGPNIWLQKPIYGSENQHMVQESSVWFRKPVYGFRSQHMALEASIELQLSVFGIK